MEKIIYQGEDQTIRVEIVDANGAPVDLSTGYSNVIAFLHNGDQTVLEKYSRTTTSGWQAIDTDEQALGVLSFHIDSSKTKLASCGKKYFEILVRKTDVDLADSNYDTIASGYIFTIKESVTATQTLP